MLSNSPTKTISQPLSQSFHGAGRGIVTTLLVCAISAWVLAVGASWRQILLYEFNTAQDAPRLCLEWPADSKLPRESRSTVVVFIHPKCPCTRATLAELERLWVLRDRDATRDTQLFVVATMPADASSDWFTTANIDRAQKLDGAKLIIDAGGREAHRFGAATSGTVMWFDSSGRRLYAGGITASRGHEGANVGSQCLEELIRGGIQASAGIPALGCRLCLPNA
jgi:hypothetical protein